MERYSILLGAVLCLFTQLCQTLCDPMDYSPPGPSVYGDSLGKNTRVGCHALLQGIYSTQGSNPGLPHCRWILYHLSHQGSPVGRLNIIKMSVLPSIILQSHCISNQNPSNLFCGYGPTDSKVYMEKQKPRTANTILKEKNQVRGLTLTDSKIYRKGTLIKTVWYC